MSKSALILRFTDIIFVIGFVLITFWLVQVLLDKTLAQTALIESVSNIGSAVALVTAWVGFYLATVRPLLNRPNLQFSKIEREENIQKSVPNDNEKQEGAKTSWFIRLRVKNSGQVAAKNCVGRLLRVLKANNQPVKKFDPLPLYWARQGEPDQFRPIDIQGNNDSFFLDVAQVKQKENVLSIRAVIPKGHRLIIDPDFPDYDNVDLPPGTYYLQIAVYGEDVAMKPTWFKLTWRDDYSLEPPCEIQQQAPSKAKVA